MANHSTSDVPADYSPYPRIRVCSNILIACRFIVTVEGQHPFLIGKAADLPLIWIKSPTDPTRKSWRYVVERSVSLLPNIVVTVGKEFTVEAETILVLSISDYRSEVPNITALDLRPFGLDISGGPEGLNVGRSKLSENIVQGLDTFLNIG
jgi:hypothetical protein